MLLTLPRLLLVRLCAVALLPPTMLMGASRPAMARWARADERGVSWWGLLYGVNTVGAVAGSLIWLAHIGMDHALGYGLKYASGFAVTHLGRIGKADPW